MNFIKSILLIIVLLLISNTMYSIEFGFLADKNTEPSGTALGFSAGMGLIIPLLKFEFELMKKKNTGIDTIGFGLKIRKKIGKFAPYAVIGAGARFDKFSITFSNYNYYTFVGGGTHLYFLHFFSLRFDVRLQSYNSNNNVRFSIGAFAHL